MIASNQLAPGCCILGREQACAWNRPKARIGDVLIAIRKGELQCFDQHVQILGRVVAERFEVEVLHDIHREQQHKALGVCSGLIDGVPLVVGPHGFSLFRMERSEVIEAQ